jgi:hypothetical protein
VSTLDERVAARALEEWYLAPDADADERPARRHPCWQSPFALGRGEGERADRVRRILKAGDIWLKNYDLRFAGQLWISDHEAGTTWAFRRCRTPGGKHQVVGPLPLVVVERGRRLFDTPLRYAESSDRELDRLLLSFVAPR